MVISRRQALAVLVASGGALSAPGVPAQSTDQWFAVTGDDGKPVPNMRLPVEVASEIDELEGAIWVGSPSREITVVEFFDYNCPYCRNAMPDLHGLCGTCRIFGSGSSTTPFSHPHLRMPPGSKWRC